MPLDAPRCPSRGQTGGKRGERSRRQAGLAASDRAPDPQQPTSLKLQPVQQQLLDRARHRPIARRPHAHRAIRAVQRAGERRLPARSEDQAPERDQVLRITRAGLALLGLAEPPDAPAPAPQPQPAPHAGTKMEAALELMRRAGGASIPELQAATSWQPHTLRALISATLRKQRGIAIERRRDNGESRYHAT